MQLPSPHPRPSQSGDRPLLHEVDSDVRAWSGTPMVAPLVPSPSTAHACARPALRGRIVHSCARQGARACATHGAATSLPQMDTPEVVRTGIAFEGPRLRVREDELRWADGATTSYLSLDARSEVACCMVARDAASGRLVLVREYRHSAGRTMLSLPGGAMDVDGETPEDCACRELAEETGFVARPDTVHMLRESYPAPGIFNQRIAFIACTADGAGRAQGLEPGEVLQTCLLSGDEVRDILRNQPEEAVDHNLLVGLALAGVELSMSD